jgi:hypothetical protein
MMMPGIPKFRRENLPERANDKRERFFHTFPVLVQIKSWVEEDSTLSRFCSIISQRLQIKEEAKASPTLSVRLSPDVLSFGCEMKQMMAFAKRRYAPCACMF